jgi:hypothetical protein
MEAEINLGNFSMPINSVTKTFGILAKRGAGKSYTAGVMMEEMARNNIPFIVFDPIDIFWGLKLNKDGKSKGLPIVVFGLEHADIKIDREMGRKIAQAVVKHNISCVISTFGMPKKQQRYLVAEFAEELLNINNTPRHIFIEEAHEFCLSNDTELLTSNGWKNIQQVKKEDKAMTVDIKTGKLKIDKIKRLIKRKYNGNMIHFSSDGIDCLVTPEHRVVMQRFQHDPARYKKYPTTFCNAQDLPNGGGFFVPVPSLTVGKGVKGLSPEMCRILGWIMTDGNNHQKGREYLCITQGLNTIKRRKNISKTMKEILLKYGAHIYNRKHKSIFPNGDSVFSPSMQFYLGKQFSLKLRKWLDKDIHSIPKKILNEGSEKQLRALYEGLLEGDGTAVGGYKNNWRTFCCGTKYQLANDFQELCLRLGISASIRKVSPSKEGYKEQLIVGISKRKSHYIKKVDEQYYDGDVWDITVPSGAFIARRNGKMFVTGNCPQRVFGETGKVFNAVSNLVVMGRNRGLGVTLINQRASTINKDVLTQVDTLIAMRLVAPQDRKALKEWVEYHSAEGDFDKFMESIGSMPTGQGWIWSPEFLGVFKKIKIRERETFHPDREKLGTNFEMPILEQADVQEFIKEFQSEVVKKDIPVTKAEIKQQVMEEKKENLELIKMRNDYESKLLQKDLELRKKDELINAVRKLLGAEMNTPNISQNGSYASGSVQLWAEKLGNGMASNIFKFLVEKYPMKFTRAQIGLGTGYSTNSGSFANALSLLRRNLLIKEEGGMIFLNPDL